MKEYIFYTGLPRSGSTLLSSLLSQNPNIYSAGNSPVCQLTWDTYTSVTQNCLEQFNSANRDPSEFIKSIIQLYYKDVESKFIFDKSRSWGNDANVYLIKKFITPNPKFVVVLRSVLEIFFSFIDLYERNEICSDAIYKSMFIADSEPIIRSYNSTLNLIDNHFDNCLFVFYEDIIKHPLKVIDNIYSFCNIEKNYTHNITNIKNRYPENDSAYGIRGMHDIRSEISKRKYNVKIKDKSIISLCKTMDSHLLKKYNAKLFYSS